MGKNKAGRYTGQSAFCARILPRLRAWIKSAIMVATLWHLLPIPVTEWLIRRLRLERA